MLYITNIKEYQVITVNKAFKQRITLTLRAEAMHSLYSTALHEYIVRQKLFTITPVLGMLKSV